jgi:ubiquinone/menaquinone biosynthesis C-methylase UbiE
MSVMVDKGTYNPLKKEMQTVNLEKVKGILGDRFSFTADDTNTAIETVKLPEAADVLDVGTGVGNMAIMLALHGHRVVTGEPAADDSIYAKQDWMTAAKKVNVDELIRFEPFDAADMPFGENRFDGIFFLGALHHIEAKKRSVVMKECVRISKDTSAICFLEPNKDLVRMIREADPSHSDAADPNDYVQGVHLVSQKISGKLFDIFVFKKELH